MPPTHSHGVAGAVYLVASLTTTPTRIGSILPTLVSLDAKHQTRPFDEIILNLPVVFTRTGETYPEALPEQVTARATINRCGHDWGPATKIVPTVRYLIENRIDAIGARLGLADSARAAAIARTHIVLVDDDVLYPRGLGYSYAASARPDRSESASGFRLTARTIAKPEGIASVVDLRKHHTHLDVCEAFAGWRIPLEPLARDVRAYEAHMLALTNDPDARISDDLLTSDYLASRGIPLLLHSTRHVNRALIYAGMRATGHRGDALHFINSSGLTHWSRYWRVVDSGKLTSLRLPDTWAALCPGVAFPALPPGPPGGGGSGEGGDGGEGRAPAERQRRAAHEKAARGCTACAREGLGGSGAPADGAPERSQNRPLNPVVHVVGESHAGLRIVADLLGSNFCHEVEAGVGLGEREAEAHARGVGGGGDDGSPGWERGRHVAGGVGPKQRQRTAASDSVLAAATDALDALAAARNSLRARHVTRQAPVVVLVREALQWLLAVHRSSSEAPWARKQPLEHFVSAPWYSWRVAGAREKCAGALALARAPRVNASATRAADADAATTSASGGGGVLDDALDGGSGGGQRPDPFLGGLSPDEAAQLSAAQLRLCSVRAFDSVVGMRSAKLRLLRDAFDLRRRTDADGGGGGGQGFWSSGGGREGAPGVGRTFSAAPGSPPILVVRYEDVMLETAAVACALRQGLGLCARSERASLTAGGARPSTTSRTTQLGLAQQHMQLLKTSPHPCTAVDRFSPAALRAVYSGLDWSLEALFGYSGLAGYKSCTLSDSLRNWGKSATHRLVVMKDLLGLGELT